jgi:predicted transcriptional regulator of viral defense system
MYTIKKHIILKMTNIKQNRFSLIAKTGEQIFHIDDLARIWEINNRRNLAVTLSRYVKAGLMYRIYRGLYSLRGV